MVGILKGGGFSVCIEVNFYLSMEGLRCANARWGGLVPVGGNWRGDNALL